MTVLPMPYHMQAMPAPRRRGDPPRAASSLKARAACVAADHAGRSASRQGRRPTLAASVCPVGVVSPATSALRWRNSSASQPVRAASSSISNSPSSVDCGTPKPRNAPATLLWVSTARVSARTLAMRYGPLAWIGTRLATVGPHDE